MTIYISLLMRLLTKTLHPSAPAPSPLSNYRTHCNTTSMEAQKYDLQLAFSSLDCFSIEKLQSKYFLSPKNLGSSYSRQLTILARVDLGQGTTFSRWPTRK